ncbi:MAG TPA: SdpI family protein [Terriglobales bacterium]|nr:SdpI family protein [Terriglobales bacterium]
MTRTYFVIVALIVLASFVATLIVYPQLPNLVPTHWDIHNQVNGYSPKWALFLFGPGLMSAMVVMFYLLPWLSPKQFEVETFHSTYLQVMVMVVAMLAYFHAVILWTSLGQAVDVGRAIVGGVCLLFALLGNVMGKVRRNFYIGIRTPWALANERVWNATHRFAAKTFVASGVIGLLVTLLGFSGWPVFILLMVGAVAPVAYSLMFYKQLERQKQL